MSPPARGIEQTKEAQAGPRWRRRCCLPRGRDPRACGAQRRGGGVIVGFWEKRGGSEGDPARAVIVTRPGAPATLSGACGVAGPSSPVAGCVLAPEPAKGTTRVGVSLGMPPTRNKINCQGSPENKKYRQWPRSVRPRGTEFLGVRTATKEWEFPRWPDRKGDARQRTSLSFRQVPQRGRIVEIWNVDTGP